MVLVIFLKCGCFAAGNDDAMNNSFQYNYTIYIMDYYSNKIKIVNYITTSGANIYKPV